VLLGNGFISAGAIAACAMVGLATPVSVVFLILFVGGFFRSLQFTALTTLSYDIPHSRTSAATSFSSMMMQVMNGMGVAVAAVLLHATQLLRGEPATSVAVVDFRIVFVLMSLVALSGCFFYARLAPDVGAEVSGHGAVAKTGEAAAD
jgi:hypothetical protein